ncbi:MAG: thermonuclease family protein [Gammaproteobacteria bacterium]|nr:thermonuclease family protein [Gammaproteobacteria bacterium]MBU1480814.1 thermonuclease family protein [Gammaproteobacteria bacterium]
MRLLLALYCCFVWGAQAETFSAKVIVVMDGDTVMVLRGGHKLKVRLAHIDAPEVGHAGMGGKPTNSQKEQAFGRQSRDSLLEMVGKKIVRIDSLAVDQYGRIVGLISVDGRDINREQVRRGMAWASAGGRKSGRPESRPPQDQQSNDVLADKKLSRFPADETYITLQNEARLARRGLWAQSDPQAPRQWRKLHPSFIPATQADPRDSTVQPDKLMKPDMKCGEKRRCSQMDSCDEARFYFTHCGLNTLDGNHDGSPCESLCGGK